MPLNFAYRYVGYGTSFTAKPGQRSTADDPAGDLYENELVVDVGSACWGVAGEERSILDHHFHRARDQFPSASSAVLHCASSIWSRFGAARGATNGHIWMVTHREPDFDAYCAMYLARAVLTGELPHDGWLELGLRRDGWPASRPHGEPWLDWFGPDLATLSNAPNRAWAILLASLAACLDNCRPMSCPRHRTLSAVLHAGQIRGRDFLRTGAVALFDEARQAIDTRQRHPLHDSVLDGSDRFAPELALLDRELAAYSRDLTRARRAIVSVPQVPDASGDWFGHVATTPLLDADLRVGPEHLVSGHGRAQIDGVYIREPECLLFKEWARTDLENAPAQQGFVFTAVAYANGTPEGECYRTRYIFALDPERGRGLHLYPVWARLQAEEIRALRGPEREAMHGRLLAAEERAREAGRRACRPGFCERAGSLAALFDDPWYDGQNYACTIVDTPNRGTVIGPPGTRADLLDDRVARLVQEELEFGSFASPVSLSDFPANAPSATQVSASGPITHREALPPCRSAHFRFAQVALANGMDLSHPTLAEQIGRVLWSLLDVSANGGVPTDFRERHLMMSDAWVGVWNRRGIAIASKPEATARVAALKELFAEMAAMAGAFEALVAQPADTIERLESTVVEAERLVRQSARLTQRLAATENRMLARFFGATRLDSLPETIRTINVSAAQRLQEKRLHDLGHTVSKNVHVVASVQKTLEWIEVFVISVYAAHLWHMFAAENEPMKHWFEMSWPSAVHWYVPVGVLLAAAAGFGIALALIQPWQHEVRHRDGASTSSRPG